MINCPRGVEKNSRNLGGNCEAVYPAKTAPTISKNVLKAWCSSGGHPFNDFM